MSKSHSKEPISKKHHITYHLLTELLTDWIGRFWSSIQCQSPRQLMNSHAVRRLSFFHKRALWPFLSLQSAVHHVIPDWPSLSSRGNVKCEKCVGFRWLRQNLIFLGVTTLSNTQSHRDIHAALQYPIAQLHFSFDPLT